MVAIIAEKPSLARNIVAGIGKMDKKNGYYQNSEYIVTWAFGHLFSLCDIEDYLNSPPETAKWTLDNLPCFPEKFRFKLKKRDDGKDDEGVKKQFAVISELLNRPDVAEVVNAGDSDRREDLIQGLLQAEAGPEAVGRNVLKPVGDPNVYQTGLAERLAHFRGDLQAALAVLHPKAASDLVGGIQERLLVLLLGLCMLLSIQTSMLV